MTPAVSVLAVLRGTRREAHRNAAVLDHISAPPPPSSVPSPPRPPRPTPAPPISKHLLSSLFAAVDRLAAAPTRPNYAFIDNDQENHFLYALVLPLIARLLAVSCPGIVCVVQLPRQEGPSEWTPPPYGPFGSSVSNASKSFGQTTPSPQETSRTPSPSEEDLAAGAGLRKSISPDSNPRTAELIRHADKILSGAEAAAAKRAAEAPTTQEHSPPPESAALDHRTLRLICNGFEVLTGKMPPARCDMGPFTMASVGWEKAAVVSPEPATKGVSMSFSNGMMILTEGVVVTFSNGSMCFLTVKDPISTVESLNISDATPVVAFSFSSPGRVTLGSLLRQDASSQTPEAGRVRSMCERANVFLVEIGHAGVSSQNDMSVYDDALRSLQSASSWDVSTGKETAVKSSKSEERTANDPTTLPRCPSVVIAAVPRAVPLFVNTINQSFIEGPYYHAAESAYENQLMSDRYRDLRREDDIRRTTLERETDLDLSEKKKSNSITPAAAQNPKRSSNGEVKTGSSEASPDVSPDVLATPKGQDDRLQGAPKAEPEASTAAGTASALKAEAPTCPASTSAPRGLQAAVAPVPLKQETTHNQRPSPMYNYYGYPQGHVYPGRGSERRAILGSQPIMGPPVGVHQEQVHAAQLTYKYYHPGNASLSGPNGHPHYHHQPAGSYPTQPYYQMPPPSMVHQPPQNNGQWHPGLQSMTHRPGPLPPPHPMDARRDMPVHFSSHSAVASVHGQYGGQYYSRLSHAGHNYISRQNGLNARVGMYAESRHPETSPTVAGGPNIPSQEVSQVPRPDPIKGNAANGKPDCPMPAGQNSKAVESGIGDGDRIRVVEKEDLCDGPSRNNRLPTDKESALKALIQMRTGVLGEGEKRQEKRSRSGSAWAGQPNVLPEHSTRGRSNEGPNTSSDACNVEKAVVTACHVKSPVHRRVLSRSQSRMSTGTNSSTSTNSHSQGGPLMHGVVTGNSHNPSRQGYPGSQRPNKRSRRR